MQDLPVTIPPQEHAQAAAIERATGTPLAEWTARLDAAGARELGHREIARLLVDRHGVEEWWAQGVTVAYEQVVGLRVVGQTCEGDFAVSASRTVPGDMDAVLAAWSAFMTPGRRERLRLEEPAISETPRWRYWRASGLDGSRASINICAKDEQGGRPRCTLAVAHKGMEDADQREAWKAAWKQTLTDFTDSLATTTDTTQEQR